MQEAAEGESLCQLSVIVRPRFVPNDMSRLQLASERLLATGDNSAIEAWCARCKLYLYEAVSNGGCKWRFLQQQVDLARPISQNLSRLLALFGMDRRLPKRSRTFSEETMREIEELLSDPHLGDATLQFCNHITSNYSFAPVLEGALKRAAWLHVLPQLTGIEAETLDEGFREGLVAYLKNPETAERSLEVRSLPELQQRIREVVQQVLMRA